MFQKIYDWINSDDPKKFDNVGGLCDGMKGNEIAGIAALAAIDVENGEIPASQNPIYMGFYQMFYDKSVIEVDAEILSDED
jgi:hypothetical protein